MSRSSGAASLGDRVHIVGAGRMGLALGRALLDRGTAHEVSWAGRAETPPSEGIPDHARARWVGTRVQPPTGTTVVVLAVPDDALPALANALATGPPEHGRVALHLSGAHTASVLEPMHAAGYAVGTLHPLQTVADPRSGPERLRGSAFAVGGEPEAVAAARRLVAGIADQVLVVPPLARPRYHAAAVIASNYLVALLQLAVRQLAPLDLAERDAIRALLPLVRGTLDNVEALGLPDALTGPISRGDAATIRLHLDRLSEEDRGLYCALGREALAVAVRGGLSDTRARQIAALLSEA